MVPYLRPTFSGRHSAVRETGGRSWRRTSSTRLSGSDLRRTDWTVSACGSRYRRGPHCLCSTIRPYFRPIGARIRWRCRAPPPCPRPAIYSTHRNYFVWLAWTHEPSARLWLTFGDGITEYVFIMRSGYSSRILDISNVPKPEPVPPPSECVSWNPWNQRYIVEEVLAVFSSPLPEITKLEIERRVENFPLKDYRNSLMQEMRRRKGNVGTHSAWVPKMQILVFARMDPGQIKEAGFCGLDF